MGLNRGQVDRNEADGRVDSAIDGGECWTVFKCEFLVHFSQKMSIIFLSNFYIMARQLKYYLFVWDVFTSDSYDVTYQTNIVNVRPSISFISPWAYQSNGRYLTETRPNIYVFFCCITSIILIYTYFDYSVNIYQRSTLPRCAVYCYLHTDLGVCVCILM